MNAKSYRTVLVWSARFGTRKKEGKDDAVHYPPISMCRSLLDFKIVKKLTFLDWHIRSSLLPGKSGKL